MKAGINEQTMIHGRDPCLKRSWIHVKVCNELIERIILNVKNGGKQASSYTVNLCRNEITLADHAKVMYTALYGIGYTEFRQNNYRIEAPSCKIQE